MSSDVTVLGAGLQGVCAALALEQRGFRVNLIERAQDCLLRASLRNEGKIHLGLIYARDRSFETSTLMLHSALRFASLLEGWLGVKPDWNAISSVPFTYVIPRDSLLCREELLSHYERVQHAYEEMSGEAGIHYLGRTPARLWRDLPLGSIPWCEAGRLQGAVETQELSLDLVGFRDIVRSGLLRRSRIRTFYGHCVESVTRSAGGFRIEGATVDGRAWKQDASIVVNCLWEGRLAIDRQLGLLPNRSWVHRLKYRLLGELPRRLSGLPSLTFVLGPFGDIVVNPGRRTYFSWYPSSMQGWCSDLTIPKSWEDPCNGAIGEVEKHAIGTEILRGFDAILPGILDSKIGDVDAGTIFAWGASDIGDPDSELHERRAIGVHAHDGYFSIDTGKLTCAPLFADRLAKQLA